MLASILGVLLSPVIALAFAILERRRSAGHSCAAASGYVGSSRYLHCHFAWGALHILRARGTVLLGSVLRRASVVLRFRLRERHDGAPTRRRREGRSSKLTATAGTRDFAAREVPRMVRVRSWERVNTREWRGSENAPARRSENARKGIEGEDEEKENKRIYSACIRALSVELMSGPHLCRNCSEKREQGDALPSPDSNMLISVVQQLKQCHRTRISVRVGGSAVGLEETRRRCAEAGALGVRRAAVFRGRGVGAWACDIGLDVLCSTVLDARRVYRSGLYKR
ncbi:hypothetical protein FB451DRAFT_1179057 [Mycena latifolia]|nr:hypothetical protein FB451DRAFT_1179057 [Mycena latifolia]